MIRKYLRAKRHKALAPLVYGLTRLIGATLRIKTVGLEAVEGIDKGKIFAGWHGRSLLPALFLRGRGVWALISHSRDGDVQNGIFQRLGFQTIRGSTGRGGMKALAESIRVLKRNETMAFTPDGPRGPTGIVQPGIVLMVKKSGAALVPVGSSCRRKWHAPTWDSYMVPVPFSRCVIVFGSPIFVSPDASDEELEQARKMLEEHIRAAQATADDFYKK